MNNAGKIDFDGQPVDPRDFPAAGAFDPSQIALYNVRAFGIDDADYLLAVRALGTVRNERKLLEFQIRGRWLGLVNCEGNDINNCPNTKGSLIYHYVDGSPPRQIPTASFPRLNAPLSDSANNYYRQRTNFAWLDSAATCPIVPIGIDIVLTSEPDLTKPEEIKLQDNCYYFSDHNITVDQSKNQSTDNVATGVVIFSMGKVTLNRHMQLTNTIVIGGKEVHLNFNYTSQGSFLKAPHPYPAVISGGLVTDGDNHYTSGPIYASPFADPGNPLTSPYDPVADQGRVNLSGKEIHGIVFGRNVQFQGNGLVTDDNNENAYDAIPGVSYPPGLATSSIEPKTWKEIH